MRITLFCILTLILQTAYSQIPNSGFENWNNGNPDWWQTANIPIVPPSVTKDSDSFSGMYSVKGKVVSDIYNKPFQPYLGIYGGGATGFVISNPYVRVTGWCKLSLSINDRFIGYVRMYNSSQETIGEGRLIIDSSITAWTEFNIEINYFNPGIPVTSTLYFTVSDSTLLSSGQIGSYFMIDDLSMAGTIGLENIPAKNEITISMNEEWNAFKINAGNFHSRLNYSLHDLAGKAIQAETKYIPGQSISLSNYNPGIYLLNVFSENNRIVKKIIVR